jgi:hypothetical protein
MQKLLLGLAILGFIVIGPWVMSAQADIIDLGEPTLVGSWAQWFQEHSIGSFDTLAIQMVSPGSIFEEPGFRQFGSSGWTATWLETNPTYAQATGSAVEVLQFELHFSGLPATPLAFDFWAWEGGVTGRLKESSHLEWSGSTWTITYYNEDPHCVAVLVPLPGAVLLLGGRPGPLGGQRPAAGGCLRLLYA